MHRFLVSAAHKSSGKTTLSIGLAAALSARGLGVQTFKKGPDYIDPMWLAAATGRSCHNLDFNLSSPEQLQIEFARHGARADVCLVEGNHGLYDGVDLDGANSNAALSRLLDLPVVLVLDARGMTRGVAPLILGYQAFDRSVRIAGVILSRLGGARHEAKLRAVIERYTDVPVLGAVQEDARLAIAERHIGLTPTNEDGAVASRIALLADAIGRQVDLGRLLALTAGTAPLPAVLPLAADSRERVRIGIARDRAFGFYYADDIEALERAGAELVPFDTLCDARLPAVDGLLIGGGFPELFMRELEANAALRGEILAAIEGGMPAYAECGGLMYLARALSWRGETRRMVGAIAADIVMHERPVGRGYVMLAPDPAHPWLEGGDELAPIPAHEFHHSSIEGLAPDTRFAYRVTRGFGVDGKSDGIIVNNLLAAYSHLRSAGGRDWAARFVAFVRRVAEQRRKRVGPGAAMQSQIVTPSASSTHAMPAGTVYLVGAGPGDPELLTLRAAKLLGQAEVIVYDHLVSSGVLELGRHEAQRIYAGKERGHHTLSQTDINHLLVRLAKKNKRVVRLKGGDPFVFGRGGEEVEALAAAGIAFEVVPGITAACGVAAYSGIPLTHRDHANSCVFVAGHLKDGSLDLDWDWLARPGRTLVVYMGLLGLPTLCRELAAHGLPDTTPAAIVQQGTTPRQRTVVGTLATLPQLALAAQLTPPTLIIIGTVVRLQSRLAWYEANAARAFSERKSSAG